jgi:hypothetical protein
MNEININGKSLPIFTEANLECMSREALNKRALDLKDLLQSIEAGNVSVPMQTEPLKAWMLATQQKLKNPTTANVANAGKALFQSLVQFLLPKDMSATASEKGLPIIRSTISVRRRPSSDG